MREYYVSTPRFTCWIQVSEKNIIINCAPILWKQWKGRNAFVLKEYIIEVYGIRNCIIKRINNGKHKQNTKRK